MILSDSDIVILSDSDIVIVRVLLNRKKSKGTVKEDFFLRFALRGSKSTVRLK